MLRADGALCVTFVNSARRQPLETYDDLVAWSVDTGGKWCNPACGERARSLKHYHKKVKPEKKALMREAPG